MSFKYSVFTENTPEMREWLEDIGYDFFCIVDNISLINN